MGSATNSPSRALRRLMDALRAAPATVPLLSVLVVLLVWATNQAGYPVTHWAPGALIVLVLLGLTLVAVPPRIREIPAPVKLAIACLAGYTALSFVSILWAGVPSDAWDGANRTLLYLLVFVLFASWRQHGASAAFVLCAWVLVMIGLAAFAALHINAGSSLDSVLPGGRLTYPAGYPNADAAQWLMAFWPAVLLARSASIPWVVRALLAGGAVVLADVALFSQSRGSLYATPVLLVLVFVLVPGRVRTFAALVPIGIGIGVTAPAVLRVGDHVQSGRNAQAALHSATIAMFAAALLVTLAVGAWAEIEHRRAFSERAVKRVHRTVSIAAVALLVVVLSGGVVAAGDPVARVRHGWHTFKNGYSSDSSGNRLVSGLGSNRYDFYRVAVDEFKAHPLLGIGVDNFAQQYLAHGRSVETPHYPHSVELRTLTETGLIGALLGLLGLGAALLAGARAMRQPRAQRSRGELAMRRPRAQGSGSDLATRSPRAQRPGGDELSARTASDELGGVVAAAALAGFVYWLAHGSVDWFWEFAGLGAPAFALLGLACALAPRRAYAELADSPSDSLSRSSVDLDDASNDTTSDVAESKGAGSAIQSEGGLRARARPRDARARSPLSKRNIISVLAALAAFAAAASLAAPWLSQRQIQSAAQIWPRAPFKAYAQLDSAARLNPLSADPYLVAGSIALRFGDYARADRAFVHALQRTPADAYATLERGAIASHVGQRPRALILLRRAVSLNPRDPLARAALQRVQQHHRVDVVALNRSILLKAQQLA